MSREAWFDSGHEPGLEEMLRDPIIRLLMLCDGVRDVDIRKLLSATRKRRFRLTGDFARGADLTAELAKAG